MDVSRIMKRSVLVCRPDEPLVDALTKLTQAGLDSMPVVDARGRLVGVLSHTAPVAGCTVDAVVGTFMQRPSSCCRPRDTLSAVNATFSCLGLSLLPVIDEEGFLQGLVSMTDLPLV